MRKPATHQRARRQSLRFQVTFYDKDKEPDTQIMSRAEIMDMDLKSYDCCRAKCVGVSGFRNPASGEWVEFGEGRSRGMIGPVADKILKAIQWNPSTYLNPKMLFELTGEESLLDSANIASRTRSLRKAFGENKDTETFIVTSEAGVAWPSKLSWISVEVFVPATEPASV